MSTRSYAAADSATMLRRNLRHALRYPSMTVSVVGMPIIMLLLFVEVLGGAMSSSLAGASTTGAAYIDYVVPGILVMTVASGSMPTVVAVCTDVTEGIVARFRTMAISRASILTGHVVGSMIQTMLSVGLAGICTLIAAPGAVTGPWAPIIIAGCIGEMLFAIGDINNTVNYCVYNYHKRLVLKFIPNTVIYAGSYCEYAP